MEVQDGIKIVTFDVSDKTNPKVLDTKVFKGYYSEVQNNPKALLVNTERNDFTIPFSCYGDGYSNYDSYSGVINFRISDGKIDIVDEYRSDVFVSSENGSAEVSRCVYVENTIYMLGNIWEYDYYIKNNTDDVYRTSIDWVDYK